MNASFSLRTFILIPAAALLVCSGCKKGDSANNISVSYEQLGDQEVNAITGSAQNGDILGRDGSGAPIRYRSSNGTWEHLGASSGLPKLFTPRCEDASGNFYAENLSVNTDNWVLPAGTTTWVHLTSPDPDSAATTAPYASIPVANSKGDLAMQTHTRKGGTEHMRIYRKSAGSTAWTLACERTLDYYNINSIADNGDVFLINASYPVNGPMVLRAGDNALKPMVDCATTIQPYCNSYKILTNAGGDALWYAGGLASHKLYKMTAPVSYPAMASYVYDMPENMCCFNGGQALLPDGTVVARMNDGTYDFYHLFIRKPGADAWVDAGLLPTEDGNHSVDIMASPKGELFTWSITLGAVNSTGHVYRINF